MTNQIAEAIKAVSPTAEAVAQETVSFSPIRWKTGWPHNLRRVPPFRDDATATLTRREVFAFAQDVVDSEFARDQIIDFLGASFAFQGGKNAQAQLKLQQFLRNKGKANALLQALRKVGSDELTPVQQYEAVVATGLPAKFASGLIYFLAGPQEATDEKPLIICSNRAKGAGLDVTSDWSADEYGTYLAAIKAGRDDHAPDLPLDAVEFALREHARQG